MTPLIPFIPRNCLRRVPHLILAAVVLSGGNLTAQDRSSSRPVPPEPPREFRGTWVATVANINWPSKPGLPVAELRRELIAILDTAQSLNLNAVIFQVRPACDALYRSQLEPWSEYLTGKQGQPPPGNFDPLAFAVEEAHKRGLELHAWFNPYRARHPSAKSPVSDNHIGKRRPDVVRRYGTYLWLDPGMPAARQHSLDVILDVVRRYDIDAVHFDDYFYPYPIRDAKGKPIPFPDEASYKMFGGGLPLSDWRRKNVDEFVRDVQRSVHQVKPWVRFGISPFGIWRPQHPPGITGLDAYEALHADARTWLQQGWVDYLVPQLYWTIDSPGQSFPKLMRWWQEQNTMNRHLWAGMNTVNVVREKDPWRPEEVINQVRLTREAQLGGHVHWSFAGLSKHPTLAGRLKTTFYAQPALPPAYPWLSTATPPTPSARLETIRNQPPVVKWTPGRGEAAHQWVVQTQVSGVWRTAILPSDARQYTLPVQTPDVVAVRAVNRFNHVSPAVVIVPRR